MAIDPEVRDMFEAACKAMVSTLGVEVCSQLTPKQYIDNFIEDGQIPRRKPITDQIEANREEAEKIVAACLGYM